ncbi:2-oxo acid dehydrogenase subunit E2 [Siculibacillus lacustris]|uniref:Dihydrolipoamide acetyltransferase component of pyruvate dehydrogenase complex n=1 Tax=Siculibacillus lacustris TaxID=1549641 RepID=A0A4Q9VEP0_9HYPH|nr:dihydrolipoamide acetyltransferase family protein [Siculibacillus lacustris]TBW33274.1 2-oxo acid dehydrogenase subunit E2 [Siculibacillus lacustris]
MATEVILPRVDMGMTTGTISKWYVEAGATIEKGQPLFEIETDKAAMEIEAPATGRLSMPAACGVMQPVGQIVGWILAEGETSPPSAVVEAPVAKPAASLAGASAISPVAEAPAATPAPTAVLRATPLARRTAGLVGLDLSRVTGSGPRGRIVVGDVRAAADAAPVAAAPADGPVNRAVAAVAIGAPSEQIRGLYEPDDFEVTPHDTMRLTIARRLTESKQTVPHFYLTGTCTLDRLLALRAELNADADLVDGRPSFKLSVNDFIIKALAVALRKVPEANVTWTDEGLLRHRHSDIGVAVSVPGGLVTPVVRRAEIKSLRVISEEMKDLAARARARRLKPEDYRGGTSAISNLGMYGVEEFAAIINPPQATILAVGVAEERIVVRNHQPEVAMRMTVTLSTDHRAVDGAVGAELLAAFKAAIERPTSTLV